MGNEGYEPCLGAVSNYLNHGLQIAQSAIHEIGPVQRMVADVFERLGMPRSTRITIKSGDEMRGHFLQRQPDPMFPSLRLTLQLVIPSHAQSAQAIPYPNALFVKCRERRHGCCRRCDSGRMSLSRFRLKFVNPDSLSDVLLDGHNRNVSIEPVKQEVPHDDAAQGRAHS